MTVTLSLPMPVSVNALYATVGKRRVKTKAYRGWIRDAGWLLVLQRPDHIPGKYNMSVRIPSSTKGDCDNYLKALGDLLQRHGVIVNDRLSQEISICRDEFVTQAHITVEAVA